MSIDLEGCIVPNTKGKISLIGINESTIQRLIKAPSRHIMLIKAMLPKMEKHEKKIRKSIALCIDSLQLHIIYHKETICSSFEAWVAFVRKRRSGSEKTSSSQMRGHLIEEKCEHPKQEGQ